MTKEGATFVFTQCWDRVQCFSFSKRLSDSIQLHFMQILTLRRTCKLSPSITYICINYG